MKNSTTAALLATLLMSATAQAELVHNDWLSAGDQRITTDTNTQLEWLKFNNDRANMSIADIQAKMQAGEIYDGWRLPTGEEVEQLMSALLPIRGFSGSGSFAITQEEAQHAQAYLGQSGSSTTYSYGLHYRDGTSGTASLTGVRTDSPRAYDDYSAYNPSTYRHSVYNAFMVNDGGEQSMAMQNSTATNVSAPFIAIGALGLFGLLARRRRS
jgi:hypothetical protein